jgi:hypothetical protein
LRSELTREKKTKKQQIELEPQKKITRDCIEPPNLFYMCTDRERNLKKKQRMILEA